MEQLRASLHALEAAALSRTADVEHVLKAAINVADLVSDRDAARWLHEELDGYALPDRVPAYRRVVGRVGATIDHARQDFTFASEEQGRNVSVWPLDQPAPRLERFTKDALAISKPLDRSAIAGHVHQDIPYNIQPQLDVSIATIRVVLETIRRRVYEWAATLQEWPQDRTTRIASRLFVDDIDSFQAVRTVPPSAVADMLNDGYYDRSEDSIQTALESILHVPIHKADWGGEINDLYTANLTYQGRRLETAFMLKGRGLRKHTMEIADCGKNGDQLLRLTESPARLFVAQFVGNISENVIRDLHGKIEHLRSQGRDAWYCIIDGQDTARLLLAYPQG